MKFVLVTIILFAGCSGATQAQSCLTQEDVRQMIARLNAPSPPSLDKKLKQELIKMSAKQRELLEELVEKDQSKQSDQKKLNQTYEDHTLKLCQILKTNGWPIMDEVGYNVVVATFRILKNAGNFELQRDLLPVIVAAIKKDPIQKREFAALIDRLRVSAGQKQIFGSQATSMGGFLVLYPIEDEANVDSRRKEYGLGTIDEYKRSLERT